ETSCSCSRTATPPISPTRTSRATPTPTRTRSCSSTAPTAGRSRPRATTASPGATAGTNSGSSAAAARCMRSSTAVRRCCAARCRGRSDASGSARSTTRAASQTCASSVAEPGAPQADSTRDAPRSLRPRATPPASASGSSATTQGRTAGGPRMVAANRCHMRTTLFLAIPAALLLALSGCRHAEDDAGPTGAGRMAPAPAFESRSARQVRELDPASGIKGAIAYGDAREVAQRAFGKPDRTDEGRRNGKEATSWAYDRLGLYLLFVENKLSQILVTSTRFRFANGLGV